MPDFLRVQNPLFTKKFILIFGITQSINVFILIFLKYFLVFTVVSLLKHFFSYIYSVVIYFYNINF